MPFHKLIKLCENDWFIPCCALFLSMFVNLAYIAMASWGADLLPNYPYSDSYWYLHRAWHSLEVSIDGGASQQFFSERPYVSLLTLGYKLFGIVDAVPFVINACLMATGIAFLVALTQYNFGKLEAVMAALLAVFYGPYIYFVGITVKTSLAICLISAALFFSTLYLHKHKNRFLFIAVLCFMAAALNRNNAMVFVVPLVAYAIFYEFRTRSIQDLFKCALTICLALSLIMVSVGWQKNKVEQDFFSPIGLNFYSGNAPNSSGGYTTLEGVRDNIIGHNIDGPRVAEEALGRDLSLGEISQYWFSKSFDYYQHHPVSFVKLQLRKLGLLLAQYAPGAPEEYRVWRGQRLLLKIAWVDFGLLLSFALVGLFFLRKASNHTVTKYLVVSWLLYAFSIIIFLVSGRYRMPLVTMMIPLAGVCLAQLYRLRYSKKVLKYLAAIVVLYLCTISLNDLNRSSTGWAKSIDGAIKQNDRRQNYFVKVYQAKKSVSNTGGIKGWLTLIDAFRGKDVYFDSYAYAEKAFEIAPNNIDVYKAVFKVAANHKDKPYLLKLKNQLNQVLSVGADNRQEILKLISEIDQELQK